MTFGVEPQQTPRRSQRAMVANRREYITKFALFWSRIADPIRSQKRKLQRTRDFDGRPITLFLLAMEMPLQFYVNIAMTKNASQMRDADTSCFHAALSQGYCQRTALISGETN